MKGERKLKLVPPPAPGAAEEPPITDEERAEAERLRGALERGHDPLATALKAAWTPGTLTGADHDALLARALGDAFAPATKVEAAAAARLRDELDGQAHVSTSEAFDVACLVRAAHCPRELGQEENEALIQRALKTTTLSSRRGQRALSITAVAVTGFLALAAGFALLIRPLSSEKGTARVPAGAAEAAVVSFIPARSASDLFDAATPFPRTGGETARIDRIASSRASDLRANRFAAWGVR